MCARAQEIGEYVRQQQRPCASKPKSFVQSLTMYRIVRSFNR
jgi:hypothetical protein